MSEIIRSAYSRTWWALLLRGVLGIAVGAFILARPLESIASFALVIAWWAVFGGAVQVVHAFALRAVFPQWWVLLLSGLVGIGFGIAALYYYPGLSLSFAVVWATWWLFLTGAIAILGAVMERRLGLAWGWTLLFGVLSVIAGVFGLMNPPVTLAAIMALIAGFAFVSGIVHLMGAFKLSSLKAAVEDPVRGAAGRP